MKWKINKDDLAFVSNLIQHQNVGDYFVYCWQRQDGAVLYVGCTCDIYDRLTGHEVINKIEPMLSSDVVIVRRHKNKPNARENERSLIQLHEPKYNKYG